MLYLSILKEGFALYVKEKILFVLSKYSIFINNFTIILFKTIFITTPFV